VVEGDFTKLRPDAKYNLILTNPPYVRHHHLTTKDKEELARLIREATGLRMSGLAGLYCYFLLLADSWLSENGFAVWLIPSEFMDVNYGREVKRYLTESVTLIRIHRFCPADVQFDDALVSSAVLVFEKRSPEPNHTVAISFGGTLIQPNMKDDVSLDELRMAKKWTRFPRQGRDTPKRCTVTLGDLFTVKRGLATGNNEFFIVPRERLHELGIPISCVRPILPSPRYVRQEVIDADADGWPVLDRQLCLIDCRMSETEIAERWPRFGKYLDEGKRRGVPFGYLASRRTPWYSQERREPAPFLCTYMGRNRERPFRFIWNHSTATAANVYLLLYPREAVAGTVRERIWDVFEALREIGPEHFFSEGRVYGGGLHKMEPAELMRLPADALGKILGVHPEEQLSLFS